MPVTEDISEIRLCILTSGLAQLRPQTGNVDLNSGQQSTPIPDLLWIYTPGNTPISTYFRFSPLMTSRLTIHTGNPTSDLSSELQNNRINNL